MATFDDFSPFKKKRICDKVFIFQTFFSSEMEKKERKFDFFFWKEKHFSDVLLLLFSWFWKVATKIKSLVWKQLSLRTPHNIRIDALKKVEGNIIAKTKSCTIKQTTKHEENKEQTNRWRLNQSWLDLKVHIVYVLVEKMPPLRRILHLVRLQVQVYPPHPKSSLGRRMHPRRGGKHLP